MGLYGIVRARYPNGDSTHYVKGNVDIFTGSDVVNIPNQAWYDWLSASEQVKRFGRTVNYASCINGDLGAQNVSIIGTGINGSGTISLTFNRPAPGLFRINWLVVIAR